MQPEHNLKHIAFRLMKEKEMLFQLISSQQKQIEQQLHVIDMHDIHQGTIYEEVELSKSFIHELTNIERVSFYPKRGKKRGDDCSIPFSLPSLLH